MGGKTLKFPARRKFVPQIKKNEKSKEEKPIDKEEHKKRMEKLRELGLIK